MSELLILSVIGACCLHINHIIIWPCCLGFILMGLTYLLREIGVRLYANYQIGD
jgi:hypothetical protein